MFPVTESQDVILERIFVLGGFRIFCIRRRGGEKATKKTEPLRHAQNNETALFPTILLYSTRRRQSREIARPAVISLRCTTRHRFFLRFRHLLSTAASGIIKNTKRGESNDWVMPSGPLESGEDDTEKRVKGSPTSSAVCGKVSHEEQKGRGFARGSSGVMNPQKGGNQDVRYQE